jgi:adenylate cyclase, class 2
MSCGGRYRLRALVSARADESAGRQQKVYTAHPRFCRVRESGELDYRDALDVYCTTMPIPAHRAEIEIKLCVPDAAAIRRRLGRLHARKISPRTHEFNTLYDTPRLDLRRRGQLTRIRIEQPASTFKKRRPDENALAILTFKGPIPSSRHASKAKSHFKIRDEAEVSVAGANELAAILRGLGLYPAFRYEKFRTTYALPGIRGLKVELDETPVGIYLELEGPVAAIDRAARLLGYARKDYLAESYGSLYVAVCRRQGRKPGDMLFSPTKKLR